VFWSTIAPRATDPDWELAAEAVAVKIRWFGLVVGILVVTFGSETADYVQLYAILALGLVFTGLDTGFARAGRVFLKDYPLAISALEALFITLLCHYESGPESPFRFYYLLSLVCCAVRYSPTITFVTCGMDCLAYALLFAVEPHRTSDSKLLILMLVVLVWVTWAASAMAKLLKRASENLRILNLQLQENQFQLETRIVERTQELEESQAQVLHQEKMAGFGLLAAGIAHEVGNPLTSISSVVQILEARGTDEYTTEKLHLVTGQLVRIQGILRELVTFSRPASNQRGRVSIQEVIDEALGIAKYYKGGKSRQITATVPHDLPVIDGVRDQIVQVIFNLVLNAIDATGKGGTIDVIARADANGITITVADDGAGIDPANQARLFRPYFTTKKQGTGLGLFVTRKIVESHGGKIECDSAPGRGTRFLVSLPLNQESQRPQRPQ
jgi:two-component system NtrC family sensor kinase